jgi:hypothetical protein
MRITAASSRSDMRNLLILGLLAVIPMALAEGRDKNQMPQAIGFSVLVAIGALAVAANFSR